MLIRLFATVLILGPAAYGGDIHRCSGSICEAVRKLDVRAVKRLTADKEKLHEICNVSNALHIVARTKCLRATFDGDFRPIPGDDRVEKVLRLARMLLGAGIDVNSRQRHNRHTPLQIAVTYSNLPLVKLLVKAGADVNSLDSDKRSPIFYAYSSKVAQFLIERGARLDLLDRGGKTLVEHFRAHERPRILALLPLNDAEEPEAHKLEEVAAPESEARTDVPIAANAEEPGEQKPSRQMIDEKGTTLEASLQADRVTVRVGERVSFTIGSVTAGDWTVAELEPSEFFDRTWDRPGIYRIAGVVVFERSGQRHETVRVETNTIRIKVLGSYVQEDIGEADGLRIVEILGIQDELTGGPTHEAYFLGSSGHHVRLKARSSAPDGQFPDAGPTWRVLPPVGTFNKSQGAEVEFTFGGNFQSRTHGDICVVASYGRQQAIFRAVYVVWRGGSSCGVNHSAPTGLREGLWYCHRSHVEKMLKGGIAKYSKDFSPGDMQPLHIAAYAKNRFRQGESCRALMASLLKMKFNINEQSRGWTPLHYAVWADDPDMVRLLLAAGANPKIRDKDGASPLSLARMFGKRNAAAAFTPKVERPSTAKRQLLSD